ncbi:MAG: alpha-amylase family protein, partial [Myxococcales bacterium]
MRERKPDVISDLWYKNAVIYNCDVRTYLDANGDGVGDFRGLTRRLDYLAGLGITALWLMPFFPSPDRDDGYDITDYYNVDSRYGTLGDFVEFTRAAHQRGIRVILDLVVNHTSDEHPWFQEARSAKRSRKRDWYVWSAKRPRDWNKGMVFPGVQKATWTRDPQSGEWYFHRFYEFQPDLNTANPEVQAEIRRIMGFWLQLGVSGFRMDAVPFVIGKKGANVKPREQYDMLRDLRAFLSWRSDDAILLAEANVRPQTDLEYFGEYGERMHMMFNFQVNQHLFYALAAGDATDLGKAMERTKKRPQSAQWGIFLRNNDELDLGRLSDAQRQKVFAEFGPDKSMQLYDRGIRRRLAPMLDNDRRRLELAFSLLLTLPGTPMQWANDKHGGFTSAKKPFRPVSDDDLYGYERVNVADQRREP